ncbi:MAG TPA: hypothetical protein VGB19_00955 [Actinomycetota bacterium]
MPRLALTALVATLAVGLTACGGASKLSHGEYQQKLNAIGKDANQQAAGALGAVLGSKGDVTKIAPQLDQAAEAIGGYADELDGLAPPDDAADANEKLVEAFRAAEKVFHEMAAAAKAGDEQKERSLLEQAKTGDFATELREAGRELTKAGYTLPNG